MRTKLKNTRFKVRNVQNGVGKVKSRNLKTTMSDQSPTKIRPKFHFLSKSGFLEILFPGHLVHTKNRPIWGRRIYVGVAEWNDWKKSWAVPGDWSLAIVAGGGKFEVQYPRHWWRIGINPPKEPWKFGSDSGNSAEEIAVPVWNGEFAECQVWYGGSAGGSGRSPVVRGLMKWLL